jgi:hypothetical protein
MGYCLLKARVRLSSEIHPVYIRTRNKTTADLGPHINMLAWMKKLRRATVPSPFNFMDHFWPAIQGMPNFP